MRIIVEFKDVPHTNDGVFVYDTGQINEEAAHTVIQGVVDFILRSLFTARRLRITP
jgi:hypothetical protein